MSFQRQCPVTTLKKPAPKGLSKAYYRLLEGLVKVDEPALSSTGSKKAPSVASGGKSLGSGAGTDLGEVDSDFD